MAARFVMAVQRVRSRSRSEHSPAVCAPCARQGHIKIKAEGRHVMPARAGRTTQRMPALVAWNARNALMATMLLWPARPLQTPPVPHARFAGHITISPMDARAHRIRIARCARTVAWDCTAAAGAPVAKIGSACRAPHATTRAPQ